ncbi:MAG: PqqD family protein [Elusimicrobia bacterium]|nr:PqqD family protein [Elusimicrobiota bacterium]
MADIKHWNLSETGMAFDPQTGESFQLNPAAKAIIERLRRGLTDEQIAVELAKEFGIDLERALRDVLVFKAEIDVIRSAV